MIGVFLVFKSTHSRILSLCQHRVFRRSAIGYCEYFSYNRNGITGTSKLLDSRTLEMQYLELPVASFSFYVLLRRVSALSIPPSLQRLD